MEGVVVDAKPADYSRSRAPNSKFPFAFVHSMIHIYFMTNPFLFGRDLAKDELVGRKADIAHVAVVIRDSGRLFLAGPRRFGKTSILRAAVSELAAGSAIVVYLDAEVFSSLHAMAEEIVAGAARALKGGLGEINLEIRRHFSSLNPRLVYQHSDCEPNLKVQIGPQLPGQTDMDIFIEALTGLEALAKARREDAALGLILDEFPKVLELGGKNAEGRIRSVVQTHSNTGYVFAGSNVREMAAMCVDPTRPFYRSGHARFIGPVPRAEYAQFLTEQFLKDGFRPQDKAVDRILDLAEEVPYNVQKLAHSCWSELLERKESKPATLEVSHVDAALSTLVRQHDCFYARIWSDLTPIQQLTLVAVVRQNGTNLQSNQTAQSIGRGPATIRRSLESMMAKGILHQSHARTGDPIHFEDPFLARWILMFVGQSL